MIKIKLLRASLLFIGLLILSYFLLSCSPGNLKPVKYISHFSFCHQALYFTSNWLTKEFHGEQISEIKFVWSIEIINFGESGERTLLIHPVCAMWCTYLTVHPCILETTIYNYTATANMFYSKHGHSLVVFIDVLKYCCSHYTILYFRKSIIYLWTFCWFVYYECVCDLRNSLIKIRLLSSP